eukprot:TRINITY_DN851_c1_g2_i1.p1 TRINITY_DN851_c1_g2~~TRINITY_DN851_c1_g2_i1.p1  ORF type:complete len:349 (+),score=107.76 TRINITY_DN851_c1_g2_i1:52-1047(+)
MAATFLVGASVAFLEDGAVRPAVVAFDNGDGTFDVVLENGTDADGVAAAQLRPWTAGDAMRAAGVRVADTPEQAAGSLRFVCVSDTHGLHRRVDVPDGDVLIHAGDFTNTGEREQVEDFVAWLAGLPHKTKVVVAGNHDVTMDVGYYRDRGAARFHPNGAYDADAVRRVLVDAQHLTYLENAACEVALPCGRAVRVWGSPYQPEFCDWAFQLAPGPATAANAAAIPSATDILVTHSPPCGQGDGSPEKRAGCPDIMREVAARVRPAVHVFGHIHSGYGVTRAGATAFVNASTCTSQYAPTNDAIVFDLAAGEDGAVGEPVFVEASRCRPAS